MASASARGDANGIAEMCATAGVAVVFVSEIKCRIQRATWWAGPSRAVIALSDRYKRDEHFWFSFFHEVAHVLPHRRRNPSRHTGMTLM